jgi:hypothetical protein
VISARTDIVHRAVALIDPDEHRRAECVTAVHVALSEIRVTDAALHRVFDRRSKDAKRAAGRLHGSLHHVLRVLTDPHLPVNLVSHPDLNMTRLEMGHWLMRWQRRIEQERSKTGKPFRFPAEKKLLAAGQAHDLLRQFNREISATKGSTFCKLAALLHGTPNTNFHNPCRRILDSVRK